MFETGQAPGQFEVGQKQTLPVATRWDSYRKQRGREWNDFLTRDEYEQYLTKFTFIKEKWPIAYQWALSARNQFEQVKAQGLFQLYVQLQTAARSASLKLDNNGDLALQVQNESFLKLLSNATAKAILDKVGSRLSVSILGKDVLGPLGLLLDMSQLYNRIQNEKLVGGVGREWDEARSKKTLSLVMDIVAADRARGTGQNQAVIKSRLYDDYQRAQGAYYQYMTWIDINRQLDPNLPRRSPFYREPDRMSARP